MEPKEFIAIEMKMLEWLRKKSDLSDSYLDENKYLDLKSGKIFAEIAKKYNVVVILVAHPRKSKDGFTNDDVSGSL